VRLDLVHVPLRDGVAGGVLCIAALHHLANEGRRIQAITGTYAAHVPLRDGVAGGVLCIAALHHLANEGRRIQAITGTYAAVFRIRIGSGFNQVRGSGSVTYLFFSNDRPSKFLVGV
jgi:hypothetical protein